METLENYRRWWKTSAYRWMVPFLTDAYLFIYIGSRCEGPSSVLFCSSCGSGCLFPENQLRKLRSIEGRSTGQIDWHMRQPATQHTYPSMRPNICITQQNSRVLIPGQPCDLFILSLPLPVFRTDNHRESSFERNQGVLVLDPSSKR